MKDSRRLAVVWPLTLGVAFLASIAAAVIAVAIVMVRMIIVPPRSREEDIDIVSVDRKRATITFGRHPDTEVEGKYSLWFSGARGHARVGKLLSETPETITRKLLSVQFGNINKARRGRFNGFFYLTPSDLRVDFDSVEIDTELGPAPAWLVPARHALPSGKPDGSDAPATWVIQVHGRAVTRAETLRAVPVFRDAGYTSLLISYRNDPEAPTSEDGLYALGDTEWHDVDAALRYAVEHGAQSVVLMGWSMGGAVVLQALTRSELSGVVVGVVLDSPVVDWISVLDFQAKSKGLIRPLRSLVYAMLGSRWGRVFTGQRDPINFARLNFVTRSSELAVPILILHSDDDVYVTSTASRALAAARPDIVSLTRFTTARHARLWNQNPELWNSSISTWLAARGR